MGVWFGLNVYSLIHGDFVHLGANTIWLLPFGTAVARRFGSLRYLAVFAVTATCASSFSCPCACSIPIAGEQSVVWQAHIGGFLAGLLLFAVFDPVPRHARDGGQADTEPTLR